MLRRVWLLVLLLTCPLWAQDDPEPVPLPHPLRHLILLDISGSMRTKGYAERLPDRIHSHWLPPFTDLISHLLQPTGGGFEAGDEVVVVPFSESVTDAKEGNHALEPRPLSQLSEIVASLPPPGGGATNMTYGLDLAAPQYAPAPKTTLIWLITDNENNVDTNQSDKDFYERLSGQGLGHQGDYSHVIFFPLADTQARPHDNLVMYLLIPGQGSDRGPWVDSLMAQVKQKTGFEGVIFRPLYSDPGRPVLEFSKNLQVQGSGPKVKQEGGTTVLLFEEGDHLKGRLKFKVRSHLKGWKIDGATLEDASADLAVPSAYQGGGNQHLTWEVSPKNLSVEPEGESADFFLLDLATARPASKGKKSGPLVLERSSGAFWSDPLASWLPSIKGKIAVKAVLKLTPEGPAQGPIQPAFPDAVKARLSAVSYLTDIEKYMVLQSDLPGSEATGSDRSISFERSLEIRVHANPLGGFMLVAAAAAVLLPLLALGLALALWKARFQLEGPGEAQEITLPYLWGSYLIMAPNAEPLATLETRLGSARLRPEPEITINGDDQTLSISWDSAEFRFELAPEGKSGHHFVLTRARGAGSFAGGQEDGPSL